MTQTVPLIRAGNVLPLVRWMEVNHYDTDAYLKGADLEYWFALSPFDPIPVLNGVELLRNLARDHGPDVGVRIVTQASLAELGFIGGVALGARTPLEALQRLSFAFPFHSSHETLRVETNTTKTQVTLANAMGLDGDSLHAVHVLFTSLIQQLCCFTGLQPPILHGVEMVPHPDYGFCHLKPVFGERLSEASHPAITISIDASIAENPFRTVARDRSMTASARKIAPLVVDNSLAASMRPVIAAMLHGGEPTINRLARAAGTSVRSLQRRLSNEGTSFSAQLDRVRHELMISHLGSENVSLAELSERLGYSEQSALSRAVRRMTGRTPSQLVGQQNN